MPSKNAEKTQWMQISGPILAGGRANISSVVLVEVKLCALKCHETSSKAFCIRLKAKNNKLRMQKFSYRLQTTKSSKPEVR